MDIPNVPEKMTSPYGFTLEELTVIKTMVSVMTDWAKEHHATGEVASEYALPALVFGPKVIRKCEVLIEFLKQS